MIDAAQEVGPSLFFSLLIITVSFLPIFTLEGQEGRLFHPLAFTKSFAMGFAAMMSLLVVLFIRGRIAPEEKNPVNRVLIRTYHPFVRFVLRHRALTIIATLLVVASTVPVFMRLGSEFMPPLYEGSLLYMPITLPGAAVQTAQQVISMQDKII